MWVDGQTDMKKVTVVFQRSAKVPKEKPIQKQ